MKQVVVRYKVKTDQAQENISYIQAVFAALDENKPAGLQYASFQLEDNLTFVHVARINTADGSNPLPQFDEFKAFSKDIADRCDEKPVAMAADTVGNFGLLSD